MSTGSQLTQSTSTHNTSKTDQGAGTNQLKLICVKFAWHLEVPVTSPSMPLVFNHNPASNREYVRPHRDALIQPNSGLYSLKEKRCRKNTAFIATEYCLCELASLLLTEGTLEEASTLYDEILEELARLNQQKEFHWEQQRADPKSPNVVVNTGSVFWTSPLLWLLIGFTDIHFYKQGPRNVIARAVSLVSLTMQNVFFTTR